MTCVEPWVAPFVFTGWGVLCCPKLGEGCDDGLRVVIGDPDASFDDCGGLDMLWGASVR